MTNKTVSNPLLEPENDGFAVRDSGQWVIEKLDYIRRYINMFTIAMADKPWRNIRYIDLFAGPGKCKLRKTEQIVLGSPLLAITTKRPFTDYFFVDLSAESLEALKARLDSLPQIDHVNFRHGDANEVVHRLVAEFQKRDASNIAGKWKSLNLAVLDPEGLELKWSTVESLAKVMRMDLIIHYSQSGLTRNMERCFLEEDDNIVDHFFGDRRWREIYARKRAKGVSYARIHRDLIDLYKSNLADLGYVDVVEQNPDSEPLIRHTSKNAPLYRLLFASKNKLGNKF
jgi:three-Cys-motif partner protein